jgi:hypothetical protein
MPECNYCEEAFDGEQSYLRHLDEEHADELGSIDRHRIEEDLETGGSGLPTGPLVIGFVLLIATLLVVYVVFFLGGESASPASGSNADADANADVDGPASLDTVAQSPGPMNTAHEHGTIDVVIDSQRVDFSRQRYQLQADEFHFENGNGDVWHKHATDVTLEWAMATLDIGVGEDTVVFDGRVYRDSDPGTDVTVEVNGEPVDPQTYVLQGASDTNPQQGDAVRIVVETNASG